MTQQDFSNSVIYHFRNKETKKVIYVGATTNFRCRRNLHVCHYKNPKYNQYFEKKNMFMRENGGLEKFEIIPVSFFKLTNKDELRIEEQKEIDKHDSLLNRYDAVQDVDKYKQQIKDGQKRKKEPDFKKINNKIKKDKSIEIIIAMCGTLDMSERHMEKITKILNKQKTEIVPTPVVIKEKLTRKETLKIYYEKNKEKLKKESIIYREINKERINAYRRKYNAEKREKKLNKDV